MVFTLLGGVVVLVVAFSSNTTVGIAVAGCLAIVWLYTSWQYRRR
jgi:hypothetical protein